MFIIKSFEIIERNRSYISFHLTVNIDTRLRTHRSNNRIIILELKKFNTIYILIS
jgi:hypothetical protein